MKKIILIILFLYLHIARAQTADFCREDITFRLDGQYLSVEGYYWFANTSSSPVHRDIYYPFPHRAGKSLDSVKVYDLTAGHATRFKMEENYAVSFSLNITPNDTTIMQIKYRQALHADSAMYILKSTQAWNKPLSRAEFKLITPPTLIIKKFTLPPDKTYNIAGSRIYLWQKSNFMPELDMIFNFNQVIP